VAAIAARPAQPPTTAAKRPARPRDGGESWKDLCRRRQTPPTLAVGRFRNAADGLAFYAEASLVAVVDGLADVMPMFPL
jgi:hypothetical protein